MPTREAQIIREISHYEKAANDLLNIVGDLKRELLTIQGKPVNDQADYGGNIHPKGFPVSQDFENLRKKLPFDPFLESHISDYIKQAEGVGVTPCKSYIGEAKVDPEKRKEFMRPETWI